MLAIHEGRRKAAKRLARLHFKAPVAIHPEGNIYSFPTLSPKKFECSWIFPNHIKDIAPSKKDLGKSVILFSNLKEVELGISYFMLEEQLQRSVYCLMRLKVE
ncbi:hypothetical protein BKP35_17255 [Anaerobacillus arseniciselenatis]|uniref:Competence protein n=1 Tax=Anaerobacillus arseniciselenatis TaxID=85682 RepID=A0A1S2LBL9_9BACI|nr:competence protein ComK [Anaerobacillus arseniciselenatis]OIJ09147.1 hypothetical protein BKP35_17255 [Anaerobacillus arseniciselenatis]